MSRDVLGAVLAGGRSRRMGSDKAMLAWAGSTLVERAAATLAEVFEKVVVIGPARRGLDRRLETVPDRVPDRGPLGGLVTALEQADGADVFLLACDLPLVGPQLVRHLLAARAGASLPAANAYLAAAEGRVQPLCGLYAAACHPAATTALDAGRLRMQDLIEGLGAVAVPVDRRLPFFHPALLHNVNRPEDYRALRAAAASR